MKRNYLFNTEKINYVKGNRPDVSCILCALRDKIEGVKSLEIVRTKHFIVSLNLYPFNPGHLMIFPIRHIESIISLTDDEALELHRLTVKAIDILQQEFNPSGFNIGANIGKGSGASISHFHRHIVPRYENEVGFLDVLAGARVVVSDPQDVLSILKNRFAE